MRRRGCHSPTQSRSPRSSGKWRSHSGGWVGHWGPPRRVKASSSEQGPPGPQGKAEGVWQWSRAVSTPPCRYRARGSGGPSSCRRAQLEAWSLGPWKDPAKAGAGHISSERRRQESQGPLAQKPGARWPAGCRHGLRPQGGGLGLWTTQRLPVGPESSARGTNHDRVGRAKLGRCLQGFPSGLRRLLHRWPEELPVWGCPGAALSL